MPPERPELPDRFTPSDPTVVLLEGARAGRSEAVDLLLDRYRERLRRWASGRLPGHARHTDDTEDLVQDVLVDALRQLGSFEQRHEGAFHGYLRTAVLNRIRNQVRHTQVRQRAQEGIIREHDRSPRSPLEELVGTEALERYERALASLDEGDRELVVARMEFDCPYAELAEMMGKPTANACRMAVKRALVRLAQAMGEGPSGGETDGATQILR